MELEPLFGTIDPGALNALVESAERNGSDLTVEFSYQGYEISVTGEGVIHLDETA